MEAATQTTRPEPKYHTIVHFEIPVNDHAKLSRFYEELFRWKGKQEIPNIGWFAILQDPDNNTFALSKANQCRQEATPSNLPFPWGSDLMKLTRLYVQKLR